MSLWGNGFCSAVVPNLGPPDVLGLQLPEASTTTSAGQDFWELKSKNIWRPKVDYCCSVSGCRDRCWEFDSPLCLLDRGWTWWSIGPLPSSAVSEAQWLQLTLQSKYDCTLDFYKNIQYWLFYFLFIPTQSPVWNMPFLQPLHNRLTLPSNYSTQHWDSIPSQSLRHYQYRHEA